MRIGVDYYPEQWSEDLWAQDMDRMAEAGVKVVRLAEFAWSVLEPEQDHFDFAWLDRAIGLLTERGMQVVLGTPTNCPPLWLYEAFPEAVQMDASGNRIAIGVRGHRCYRSSAFLQRAALIIEQMVCRYRENPHVIAYQIDNELEANFCRCPYCQEAFRTWLQGKYGTLAKLNQSYGNCVWSGSYSAWSQVRPPMGSYAPGWYNPSLMLDYHRFAAADTAAYVRFQIDCIRKHCPRIPITTNTWFCDNHVDFHGLFRELDFVSYDNYPTTQIPHDEETLYSHAFHLDFMRGIKQQNFWIMEQLSGGLGSWAPMGRTTAPGMIKGYALQAFAHGADTVVHFRWRTAAKGAEMFWHGILDHSNCEGRRYAEFMDLCKAAEVLSDAVGSAYRADVAILYDGDTDFALKIQPQTDGFHYLQQLKLYHDACISSGVNVDIISADASLEDYRIVVVPSLYITHEAVTEKLHNFVEKGGVLVLTARSGVKNEYNNCIMESLPTVYRALAGAYAEEYDPIGYGSSHVEMHGKTYRISQWCDVLVLETAQPAAIYTEGFYAGKTAVTRNRFGNGTVYYVGTVGERKFCHALMRQAFDDAGISYITSLPLGVEVTERRNESTVFRFIFNNSDLEKTFNLYGHSCTLQPFEMAVERYPLEEFDRSEVWQ